jgi:predicted RNA-binding Zn ribbon-like protein
MAASPVSDVAAPAPGPLAVVQAFVNTADLETGADALADPAALAEWLRAHGLAGAGDACDAGDLRRAVAVREALRRILRAHNGAPADPAAARLLREAGRAAPLRVSVTDAGRPELVPAGAGLDAALGRLLAVVARAGADGTWERLKACPAEDCQWAFYDFSRNRSRTWCSMRVCGNRAKARAYRARGRGPS